VTFGIDETGVLMGCRYQLLGGFKMNREEFEQEKETGVKLEEQDAAVQEEEIVDEEVETDIEDREEDQEDDSEDDLDIPEEQKTAFAKRLEREQKKIREQTEKELEQRLEQKYEQKYSKHDSIIERLGGDPDQVERMINDNEMKSKVYRLAEQEGWDEEQIQWYIQQQKKDQEVQELKVQVAINDLKDNPDYAGIGSMKKEIQTMISRSGGAIDVKQAYWALGGEKRAEQLRRETEQRNIVKRSKAKRTVQSDSPTSTTGDKPLDAENERIRQKMGLSLKEAKALLNDTPNNLEAYRKKKG
jgi:hypothetical protein